MVPAAAPGIAGILNHDAMLPCKVCGSPAHAAGEKMGGLHPRLYHLYRCEVCGFAFVADLDAETDVYDEAYYRGKGADPLLDYVFELERPDRTVRRFEWAGIERIVRSLHALSPQTRWLDYGCGNGGLVRWAREHTPVQAFGFEEGWIADEARARGIPILTDAQVESNAPYDAITAVEVLEHVADPKAFVERVARLLAPGGVFFYTTGNVTRHARRLAQWGYVVPEIHISFFEPRTMERLFADAGLLARRLPWSRGFADIVTFKILKNLGVRQRSALFGAVPWGILARAADALNGVSAFPAGIKPESVV
jgi:cyclopropane fatty-acyl-phospholipid synthase-like methyltransferase